MNLLSFDDLASIAIGSIVLVLCYTILYNQIGFPKRASGVIGFSLAVITTLYLFENPSVLQDTKAKIAIVMIAAVVALANLIKNKIK